MLSVIRRANDVKTLVADWHATGRRVGFVPTMGGLHEGHAALIRRSLEECDKTIVSIFLNPLQFDRSADLASYPHDEKADVRFVADLGVQAVFYPSVEEMYPRPTLTRVTQEGLTAHLDGAARPGFFDGILTVVTKLFHIVGPDVAWFGEKDFQQVAVVRRMVEDLNFGIEIRSVPTARAADGLALSSRNALLSEEAREEAPRIYLALKAARDRLLNGCHSVAGLMGPLRRELEAIPAARIDYASIVDPRELTLREETAEVGDLLAVAVFLGDVRLIDNIILAPAGPGR